MRPWLRLALVAAVAVAAVFLPAAVSPSVLQAQADPTPHPDKVFATHPPRGEGFITEYVVEWKRGFLEPGPPGDWEWIWTKKHPPGTDCGKFNRLGRTGSWEHFHPPCPEQHPHEAHIHVWFGKDDVGPDDDWECMGLYEFGSAAGRGKEEPKCSQPWIRSRPDVPEEIALEKKRMKEYWNNATWAWGAAGAAATAAAVKFPAAAVPLGGFAAFCGLVAVATGRLALDPPDANFRQIARPSRRAVRGVRPGRGVSPAVAASLTRVVRQMGELEALLRVHLASLERAWGAANARDLRWMRRQQEAAAGYARNAAAAATSLSALRARAAQALRASRSPLLGTAPLRDARRQVVRRGIPASFMARLRRGGLTAAQIRGARKEAARLRVSSGFAGLLTSPNLATSDRRTARILMQYVNAVY